MRLLHGMRTTTLALTIVAAACGGTVIGPENQLEVTNAVDELQFQLTALEGVTDSRTYSWVNTGTAATIDISQAITAGSATLTIRDAIGTVMYQNDIADDNDTTTPEGVAGEWTIEVRLESVSGTFNFRVQKAT